MTRAALFICFSLAASFVFASPGDELIVEAGLANLRDGPSINDDVVLQLDDGSRLYEIQRNGKWVEVRTEPDGGTTGWIHSSLVKPGRSLIPDKQPDKEERLRSAFEKFKQAFDTLNARIELETGAVPFTRADYVGNGAVRITAAEGWLNLSRIQRERNLSEIFQLWDEVVDVGLPVSVDIVNTDDERLMVMFR